jgi:hypothetical protein
MIRNDENGHKVVSHKVNNGWFQVDKSYLSKRLGCRQGVLQADLSG